MPNSWNDPPDQGRRRPEPDAIANSGVDRTHLWGNDESAGDDLHVFELLQRLESESNIGAEPIYRPTKQQPTKWAQWDPEITCSACRYLNPADQKFCGYCGAPLQVSAAAPVERSKVQEPKVQAPKMQEPKMQEPENMPEMEEARSAAAPLPPPFVFEEEPRAEVPVFPAMSLDSRQKDESDLEFLRYKTLGVAEPTRSWKTPTAVVVLAIAGFIGYRTYNGLSILPTQGSHQSTPATAASLPPPSADQSEQTVEPDSSFKQSVKENPVPPAKRPTEIPPSAKAAAVKAKPPAPLQGVDQAGVTPATQRAREDLATAGAITSGGREELAKAERYLSPSSRDSAEAAKWLWKAVGKENGRAVLLLSDLYAQGDGVAQSCDQARLLLTVAAKKGNADAASHLRSFDSAGCQ